MALAFGIISILLGVFAPWLGGWIGFAVAAVFGVLGVVFCITKNNKLDEGVPKKRGGMICGIIGVAVALLMQLAVMGAAKSLMQKAKEAGNCPIYVECGDVLSTTGVIGLAAEVSRKGYNPDDLSKELDSLTKMINNTSSTTTNTTAQ